MKILQLCHKPPFPPVDGTAIAMSNLTRGLVQNDVLVDILAINTYKQYCDDRERILFESEVNSYTLIDVDIKVRGLDAFLNLFTSKSYNISRFVSNDFEKKLVQLLEDNHYDAVIFDSLFTAPYVDIVRSHHEEMIIHRSHNVEFNIWNNLAKNERNPLRKWYLSFLTKRLKKFELPILKKFDLIATISKPDLNEYRKNGVTSSMFHLPFGVNLKDYPISEQKLNKKLKIYHVGSMNWIPHQEAFQWFFEFVWSKLDHLKDMLELHLAGTDMPNWIKEKSCENVFVSDGYVEGNEFAKDKELLIVPSFSGSGIRIKIIEAMAARKPILTTANGAMGIDCKHGEHIFIFDKPEEWVALISDLVFSLQTREMIGKQAREYCDNFHNHLRLSELLLEKLLTTKP